jgi:hypothetical protein
MEDKVNGHWDENNGLLTCLTCGWKKVVQGSEQAEANFVKHIRDAHKLESGFWRFYSDKRGMGRLEEIDNGSEPQEY